MNTDIVPFDTFRIIKNLFLVECGQHFADVDDQLFRGKKFSRFSFCGVFERLKKPASSVDFRSHSIWLRYSL